MSWSGRDGARGVVVLCLVVVASARLVAKPDDTTFDFHPADAPATGVTRLVVVVHGLSGREAIQPTIDLAAEALAPADLLVVDYDARIMSNANVLGLGTLAFRIHWGVGAAFTLVVLGLLTSI